MTKAMSYRMAQALRHRRPLVLLAEIEHPDGTARFWSGIGPLNWNGHTWTGSGVLGAVTPIRHTSELMIQEIAFNLSGVDPAIAASLSDDVRNRAGKCWLACLSKSGAVIEEPYQIVDSEIDYQSLSASDEGAVTISIKARTGFYTLERSLDEVWSAEDQKRQFATDSGLDLISLLQNKDIQWTPS